VHLKRPLSRRMWDVTGWRQLARLVQEYKPDVVQVNAGDTLKFAVFSKFIYGWKTPLVFRNANKMSDFIDGKGKYWFNRFLLRHVQQVISVSEQCSLDLVNFFNFPEHDIITVEIGIELDELREFPADLLELQQRGPLLLNVAGMVPEKNQQGLLRIFKSVLKDIPDAQLLIIGTGILDGALKKNSVDYGVARQVHFLGNRFDVREIMKGCHAFVLPSLIEGLPAVILEAMYARCPVVAYDVGGIGEVVHHRKTGMLIPKEDENLFRQAVVEILTARLSYFEMKEEAFRLVSAKFSNAQIAKRFELAYKKILAR
jgi:glycosyltransferase involved in cell wall biosynthesis